MGIIEYQNWDGVTAGTIPSGWGVSIPGGLHNAITTETAPLGCTPISSPNVLSMISSGSTPQTITRSALDGNAGNVQIQADGFFYNNLATAAFSVLVRGSASTLLYASSTFYEFCLSGAAGSFTVNSIISGTSTNLFSVSTSALANGVWYSVQPVLVGSSITFAVVRLSDSMYLSMTTGTFGFTPTFGLINDSSISGQGYCGLGMLSTGLNQTLADDFTLSTAGVIVPQQPPSIARLAAEAPGDLGYIIGGVSRIVPPTPQFSNPHRLVVRGFDLPPEEGRVYFSGQRTPSVAAVAIQRPIYRIAREDPPDGGSVAARHAFPQPTPQNRPAPAIGVSQEQPTDRGSVIHAGAFPAIQRTDLARYQQRAVREELAPEAGWTYSGHAAGHVNLRTPPSVVASCEALQPHAGQSIHFVAPAPPVFQTSTPRSAIVHQTEQPVFPGSVVSTHGPGITQKFTTTAGVHVVRAGDAPPTDGQVMASHTFRAAEKPPGRSYVVTTESTVEPGRAFDFAGSVPAIRKQPSRIIQAEFTPSEGTVQTSHAVPTIRVQPPRVVQAEQLIDPGSSFVLHGRPVATPQFSPPPRGLVVVGRENDPFTGSVAYFVGHVPGLDEEYNYVDADLSSLIIETATDPFDIDPERSSLITD